MTDRLDAVHGDLAAAYVNQALISGAPAQPADNAEGVTVRGGRLSPEDKASLDALFDAWDRDLKRLVAKAPPAVRDRFFAKILQSVADDENDPERKLESNEGHGGSAAGEILAGGMETTS
jgi:hypothetical protein